MVAPVQPPAARSPSDRALTYSFRRLFWRDTLLHEMPATGAQRREISQGSKDKMNHGPLGPEVHWPKGPWAYRPRGPWAWGEACKITPSPNEPKGTIRGGACMLSNGVNENFGGPMGPWAALAHVPMGPWARGPMAHGLTHHGAKISLPAPRPQNKYTRTAFFMPNPTLLAKPILV
jgi:hypothetical protein